YIQASSVATAQGRRTRLEAPAGRAGPAGPMNARGPGGVLNTQQRGPAFDREHCAGAYAEGAGAAAIEGGRNLP
ncbi:hypothetical protein THAOC_18071, partial [Thalassiosira oceanica]